MDVLVIGGSGLVGTNVVQEALDRDFNVLATYHSSESDLTSIQLDKTNAERTREVIEEADPDLVVDTAAFHAVDDCETNRDRAWTVNGEGTRNVAIAANETDAHLVYLSTDYVFSGRPDDAPYSESDPVRPINYYAESKYAAEQAAKVADRTTILRPSVIYGTASSNFVTWALEELEKENAITIVDDQVSAPTYAPDLAKTCLDVGEQSIMGLYHSTGPTSISRYEFTQTLAEVYGLNKDLVSPISSEEFGQDAPRPEDSTLDSSRLYEAIEYNFREPADAFQAMRDAE